MSQCPVIRTDLEIAAYPEGFKSVDLSQFQSSISPSLSAQRTLLAELLRIGHLSTKSETATFFSK